MKTISKTVLAAAVALIGSTAMAQSPYQGSFSSGNFNSVRPASGNFGPCPGGVCGTKAGCTNGSCGVAGCPDGKCGPMGCPDGKCGVGTGSGVTYRHLQPVRPQSASLGYNSAVSRPFYGTAATAACPNGNCPRTPAVTHAVGFRNVPAATANCPNGRCGTVPVPRYPNYQAPRPTFLGMKW